MKKAENTIEIFLALGAGVFIGFFTFMLILSTI